MTNNIGHSFQKFPHKEDEITDREIIEVEILNRIEEIQRGIQLEQQRGQRKSYKLAAIKRELESLLKFVRGLPK